VPGTSYLRYRGEYILPATHLPYAPHGPAVWRVAGADGLAVAVGTLLREPLERRSRGHAAAQVCGKRFQDKDLMCLYKLQNQLQIAAILRCAVVAAVQMSRDSGV
jgi:hypothetical protein